MHQRRSKYPLHLDLVRRVYDQMFPCLSLSFLQHTIRCDRLMDVVPLILGQFSRRLSGSICTKVLLMNAHWHNSVGPVYQSVIHSSPKPTLTTMFLPVNSLGSMLSHCERLHLPATLWLCVYIKVLTQFVQCYLLFQGTQSTLFFWIAT